MIKSISGHKFRTNKSERFLFRLEGIDLEQKVPREIDVITGQIRSDINLLRSKEIIKVYSLKEGIFLDTPYEEVFQSQKLIPETSGLASFFGMDNFYSYPEFAEDFAKINGQYIRFVSISPDEGTLLTFGELQRYGEFFIILRKIDTKVSKVMVDQARKVNHGALYKMLSDIEGIEAYRENEEMLKKIITNEEGLFKVDINFVLREVSEEALFDKTTKIISSLSVRGLGPKISTFSLNDDFINFTPGLVANLTKEMVFHSSLLLNCLPIHQDRVHDSGVSFFARSGEEISFDSMKGDSYSICVTGVTGSGKTFCVKKIVTHDLEQGRGVFIIDPKEDYLKFALLNNFRIIEKDINPMIFKDDIYFRDIVLSKIPVCERTKKWDGMLLKAIRSTECYKEDDFFTALALLERNGFSELEYYFEELKGRISTKKEDITDRVYVLSSSFTSESLSFLLSFAFEYLKRMNKPHKFVVDEAHRVFKHDPVFLEERVREMRVKNSGLIPITQSYNDLIQTNFGQVVADNCHHKLFFQQSLKGSLGLDEFDEAAINSLAFVKDSYSECYYKTPINRKVMRICPSLRELELYRSGEEEQRRFLSYVRDKMQYFTMDESINQYVRDKYAQ